jgi:predicted nucleic acid-binding protein
VDGNSIGKSFTSGDESPGVFDTNIFIYADDKSDPVRQARAIQLIASYQRAGLMVISLQVLQEYFAAATRKLHVDPETAQRKVEVLARARILVLRQMT